MGLRAKPQWLREMEPLVEIGGGVVPQNHGFEAQPQEATVLLT